MLAPGAPIPELSLPAADGQLVRLRGLVGAKTLVLYFYPKDLSPGCTKHACGFRDAYETFIEAGADVIGVSAGSPAARAEMISTHKIPFALLHDVDGSARAAFGVGTFLGLDMRVTFVIDRSGLVRHVSDSQLRVRKHISEALVWVKQLA